MPIGIISSVQLLLDHVGSLALGGATSDPFPLPSALPGVGLPGAIATVFPAATGDFLWTEEMKEQFLLSLYFLLPFILATTLRT